MHTWELMGGVGNQLFQYFTAKNLDNEPIFDVSLLRPPYLAHAASSIIPIITDRIEDRRSKLKPVPWTLREKILQIGHHNLASPLLFGKYLRPVEVGFDENTVKKITSSDRALTIRGYFASPECMGLDISNLGLPRLDLCSEQIEIPNGLEEFSALHIRLGDFVKLGWNLPPGYYRRGLQLLLEQEAPRKLVLFSDDPKSSKEMMLNIPESRNFSIEAEPRNLTALQSLWVMSNSKAMVLSHSTFSWWAAITNEDAEQIVSPSKFDKALIPPSWQQIPLE